MSLSPIAESSPAAGSRRHSFRLAEPQARYRRRRSMAPPPARGAHAAADERELRRLSGALRPDAGPLLLPDMHLQLKSKAEPVQRARNSLRRASIKPQRSPSPSPLQSLPKGKRQRQRLRQRPPQRDGPSYAQPTESSKRRLLESQYKS